MNDVVIAPEVVDLLWPGAKLVPGRSAGNPGGEIYCLPSIVNVRSMIPAEPSHVATGVVFRRLTGRSTRSTIRRLALTSALRTGIIRRGSRTAHLVPDSENGLTEFISEQLGQDVAVAVHLGAPRANQKPVLELVALDGGVVAFGKLGINPLTDALVVSETGALRALANREFTHVIHPEVVASTGWQGHPLLLQTPLQVEHARPPSASLVAAAAQEVWAVDDLSTTRLADSQYFARLTARISALPAGEVHQLLRNAAASLGESEALFSFGAWHGDWTSWNMSAVRGQLLVWDWERYERSVPVGLDLLHHTFQSLVQRDPKRSDAHAQALHDHAPQILPQMHATTARATAKLYVIEISTRYTADGQAEAGGRLGHLLPWAAPVLARPDSGATDAFPDSLESQT